MQPTEPEKPLVVLWFGRTLTARPAQPLHPLLCQLSRSVPLPSISTSPVTTHRGSSLVENAQLYQLIFLSKTNYPSWAVWLTERALTPGRCCYWCDLVLAPRSAFLLSTLLAYFPYMHSAAPASPWQNRPSPTALRSSLFLLNERGDVAPVSPVRHRTPLTDLWRILQKAHHTSLLSTPTLLLCSYCGERYK